MKNKSNSKTVGSESQLTRINPTQKQVEAFKRKVDINPNGCWPYKGFVDKSGIGTARSKVGLETRNVRAHRLAMVIFGGINPLAKIVMRCPKCPSCVNPDHLTLGSMKDRYSNLEKKKIGRDSPSAKMTMEKAEEVRRIWSAGDKTQVQIAQQFQVSPSLVSMILAGKRWKES